MDIQLPFKDPWEFVLWVMANMAPVALGAGVVVLIGVLLVVGIGGRRWRRNALPKDGEE